MLVPLPGATRSLKNQSWLQLESTQTNLIKENEKHVPRAAEKARGCWKEIPPLCKAGTLATRKYGRFTGLQGKRTAT